MTGLYAHEKATMAVITKMITRMRIVAIWHLSFVFNSFSMALFAWSNLPCTICVCGFM